MEKTMKWISVKDRLPEDGERVLFMWKQGADGLYVDTGSYAAHKSIKVDNHDCRYSMHWSASDKCYYVAKGWTIESTLKKNIDCLCDLDVKVLFWMPLPAAPEVKE